MVNAVHSIAGGAEDAVEIVKFTWKCAIKQLRRGYFPG